MKYEKYEIWKERKILIYFSIDFYFYHNSYFNEYIKIKKFEIQSYINSVLFLNQIVYYTGYSFLLVFSVYFITDKFKKKMKKTKIYYLIWILI